MMECGASEQISRPLAFSICGNMNLISCSSSVYVNFFTSLGKKKHIFVIQGKAGAGKNESPWIIIKGFSLQVSNNLRD